MSMLGLIVSFFKNNKKASLFDASIFNLTDKLQLTKLKFFIAFV